MGKKQSRKEKHQHQKQEQLKQEGNQDQGAKRNIMLYLAIFLFAFLLYSNTFNHDYALDDDVNTRANKYVQQGLSGIPAIVSNSYYHGFNGVNEGAYRPVVLVNMAIEKHFWGNDPQVGHMFNVLFYGLACVLLFVFLQNLFRGRSNIIPLVITLLYVAHPIHTEVVANIKSRDEILCFLFIILTLNFLAKYINGDKAKYLIISLVCYFISLVTKEYGLTLIAIIPVLVYIFSEKTLKQMAIVVAPYFAVAGAYFILRTSLLENIAFEQEMDLINNSLVGATNLADRLATSILILGKYVVLLFYPHPLSFDYSYNQIPIVGWGNINAIFSLLMYLALGGITFYGFVKKDPLAFGIAFFIFTLSIVSNLFVEIGATLAERFLFIPSLGFCIAIVLVLAKVLRFDPLSHKKNTVFYLIIAAVLIAYSVKTYDRNADWKNNITLFATDVSASPNSARTHFSLASALNNGSGNELDLQKRAVMLNQSIVEFNKSLEIYPDFSSAWYNMGVAYFAMGKESEAKIAYGNAITLSPNDKQALNNLGVIYFNDKEYDKALGYFESALKVNPSFDDSYANIGAVYHNLGELEKAITYYDKALALNPQNKGVIGNLAKAHRTLGNNDKANYYSNRAQ